MERLFPRNEPQNLAGRTSVPVGFSPTPAEPIMRPPVPTPIDQGYRPNPFIRSPLPGLSDPDQQRQFYGRNGVQLKRFLPLANG